jgi:hypothetical protein
LGDLNKFQERYRALRQQMIVDGMSFGLPIHSNDLPLIIGRLSAEGASFVKVTLPLLGKALDLGLVTGQFSCPANFRLNRNTRLPLLFYSLFERVFDKDGVLLAHSCIKSIRFLRQFLLLDAKLVFEPPSVMKKLAVDEFSERMLKLRSFRIPTDNPLLRIAKAFLGETLANLDLSDIKPGHGPGSVAEHLDRFGRWDFTTWPAKAERFYPYIMYGTSSLRALLERSKGIPLVRNCSTRCCLVPKDFKGPRLISAETTVNQYLQQGQMKKMMRFIDNHPTLKQCISLRDQTRNQILAKTSVDDDTATLDLSNASDTISVPLFWYLFSEVPRLRRYLMSTRSDFMVFEGRKIKITSFAPMGSATCFPVETLVFASLAYASIAITRLHPGGSLRLTSSSRAICRTFSVFGDDIIIPKDSLQYLLPLLTQIGCQPNMSKTCWRTPMRESCGSEWFAGNDITIVRNRRYEYGATRVDDQPVLCDLQRKFFLWGYYNTAVLLRDWCNQIAPVPTFDVRHFMSGEALTSCRSNRAEVVNTITDLDYICKQAYSFDRHGGCFGFYDDFDHCRVRYNTALHRHEYRGIREFQRSYSWTSSGYPRLLARLLDDQTERIALRDRKVKKAWVVLPWLYSFRYKQ